MPYKFLLTLVASCLVALLAGLAAAVPATASQHRSVPVDVRAMTTDGRVIADHRQYTRGIGVRTSPRADCFGQGTGGSGQVVRVGGGTALGVLAQAARFSRGLRPLLLTDAFDFGLGICGIGGRTPADRFWYFKADHQNPEMSAEHAEVRARGSVLWYLCEPDESFSCGSELTLHAPVRAMPGRPFNVRVTGFDDAGSQRPVGGASVRGAQRPTDARGVTQVTLSRSARLQAKREGDIPTGAVPVCVSDRPADCPRARGIRIMGSQGNDRIRGTRGADVIRTGPGNNIVNVRGGDGRDRVLCGGGRNIVLADAHDIVRGCSVVRRR